MHILIYTSYLVLSVYIRIRNCDHVMSGSNPDAVKSTKYKDLNLKAPVNIKTFSHRWAPKHVITSYKAISMNKNINQYAI